VIYGPELEALTDNELAVLHTFTRSAPAGWVGYARRIDAAMLADVAGPLGPSPQVYICGPTLLVESAAGALVQAGIKPSLIRTERFGPSGNTAGGG
jgi:ferredoxin-NADP reductase